MKTVVLLLVGALAGGALVYVLREPARVETRVVADATSATAVTAVVAADGPATHDARWDSPVPAEFFDRAQEMSSSSPSSEGMPKMPVQTMRELFAGEVADSSWRANVEPRVDAYLKDEEIKKLVDVVSSECRKTTCEIRAAAPSVELNSQSVMEFQIRIRGMSKESWWTGYGFKSPPDIMVTTVPDGRAIMIAYLSTRN